MQFSLWGILFDKHQDKKLKVVTEMERLSWSLPVAMLVEKVWFQVQFLTGPEDLIIKVSFAPFVFKEHDLSGSWVKWCSTPAAGATWCFLSWAVGTFSWNWKQCHPSSCRKLLLRELVKRHWDWKSCLQRSFIIFFVKHLGCILVFLQYRVISVLKQEETVRSMKECCKAIKSLTVGILCITLNILLAMTVCFSKYSLTTQRNLQYTCQLKKFQIGHRFVNSGFVLCSVHCSYPFLP